MKCQIRCVAIPDELSRTYQTSRQLSCASLFTIDLNKDKLDADDLENLGRAGLRAEKFYWELCDIVCLGQILILKRRSFELCALEEFWPVVHCRVCTALMRSYDFSELIFR
jgi:hypothetical protein